MCFFFFMAFEFSVWIRTFSEWILHDYIDANIVTSIGRDIISTSRTLTEYRLHIHTHTQLSDESTFIDVRNWLLSIWCVRSIRWKLLFLFFFGWIENHKIWFRLQKMHGATYILVHWTDTPITVHCVVAVRTTHTYMYILMRWFWFVWFAFCSIYLIWTQWKRFFHLHLWHSIYEIDEKSMNIKIDCLPFFILYSFMASNLRHSG